MITVLAGGVGAARLLAGLLQVVDPPPTSPPSSTSATTWCCTGCTSAPTSTPSPTRWPAPSTRSAAGAWPARRGRPWRRSAATAATAWFNLGDRDLGTHLYRTAAARRGRHAHRGHRRDRRGLGPRAAAAAGDRRPGCAPDGAPVDRTRARSGFQEYFVQRQHARRRHRGPLRRRRRGPARRRACSTRSPTPSVVVIAPSNPIVSIGPVLAVPGIRDAVDGPPGPTWWPSRRSSPARRSRARPTGCCASSATSRRWSAWPASTPRSPATLVIDEADADLGRRGRGRGRCAASWRPRSCTAPTRPRPLAPHRARRRR